MFVEYSGATKVTNLRMCRFHLPRYLAAIHPLNHESSHSDHPAATFCLPLDSTFI